VHGLFNLRGEVIPILDLAKLLGLQSVQAPEDRRVAVIDCGDRFIGLVIDRTGAVLRISQEERRGAHTQAEVAGLGDGTPLERQVLDGVLVTERGQRLIQVLSPELLGVTKSLPFTEKRSGDDLGLRAAEVRRKAVVASLAGMEFAFAIEEVVEIQDGLEVAVAPRHFEHQIGVVSVRDELRPVLDLSAALGLQNAVKSARSLMLFLANEDTCFAIPVDSLVDTIEYLAADRVPLPKIPDSKIFGLCKDVITAAGGRNVLCLSVSDVIERYKLREASRASGLGVRVNTDLAVEDGDDLEYFSFRVGVHTLSLPLNRIREVRHLSAEQGESLGSDQVMAGLIQLRGAVVPLVNLPVRLELAQRVDPASCIVMIVEHQDRPCGLLVDAIDNIMRVRPSAVSDISHLLRGASKMEPLLNCIAQALRIEGSGKALQVLDVDRLLAGVVGD
jgi:purine-binding chemotaxis protein CheW